MLHLACPAPSTQQHSPNQEVRGLSGGVRHQPSDRVTGKRPTSESALHTATHQPHTAAKHRPGTQPGTHLKTRPNTQPSTLPSTQLVPRGALFRAPRFPVGCALSSAALPPVVLQQATNRQTARGLCGGQGHRPVCQLLLPHDCPVDRALPPSVQGLAALGFRLRFSQAFTVAPSVQGLAALGFRLRFSQAFTVAPICLHRATTSRCAAPQPPRSSDFRGRGGALSHAVLCITQQRQAPQRRAPPGCRATAFSDRRSADQPAAAQQARSTSRSAGFESLSMRG